MSAPSGRQVELAHTLPDGRTARAVVVEVGGGLRTYEIDGVALLDGYAEDAMADGGRGAVLAPWPNRIEGGRYSFDGHDLQLALSEPARGNAIHGLARWARWDLLDATSGSCSVEHRIPPQPGYPFDVRVRVDYALTDDGLTVTTRASNDGGAAAPYGTGAHPYLTVGSTVDELVLTTPADTVLVTDERGIPRSRRPVEGTDLDLRDGRRLGGLVLDHAFTGLTRDGDGRTTTRLTDPATGRCVTLWADRSYTHLMLFTGDTLAPARRRRSVAVEPMTCPPDAFRTGEDVIRLEPGASTTSTWGIREVTP